MKQIFFLLTFALSLTFHFPATAQDSLFGMDGNVSYSEWKRFYAQQQYEKLQKGALLVRLQTKNKAIQALRTRGQNESADKIAAQQKRENERIVAAFRQNFDFAPVFFFYSDDSKFLLENTPDQITFLNPDLTPVDSSVSLEPKTFVVAEFGTVSAEPREYYENYRRDFKGKTDSAAYLNSSEMDFSALVLLNDDLQQLTDPFPYYVRLYKGLLFFERSYDKAVSILNRRLHEM